MKMLTVIILAVFAIGISMGAGKYNACHQDCCVRSFSNYNTMEDTCDIDGAVTTEYLFDNYVACMKACDETKPALYNTVVEEAKNLTGNITNPVVIVHPVQINSTTSTNANDSPSGSGSSGGLPFCAPAVAFLAIIGLLYKR